MNKRTAALAFQINYNALKLKNFALTSEGERARMISKIEGKEIFDHVCHGQSRWLK
jgi:hypothetical protein